MTLSTDSMKALKGTVTVKIIRPTIAGGKMRVAGEIIDIPANEGRLLMNIGKAVKAKKPVLKSKKAKNNGDD